MSPSPQDRQEQQQDRQGSQQDRQGSQQDRQNVQQDRQNVQQDRQNVQQDRQDARWASEDKRDALELRVGWGRAWGVMRGAGLVWLVAFLVVEGAIAWAHVEAAKEVKVAHEQMLSQLQLQTCVLSLTTQERIDMRRDISRVSGRVSDAMFLWCPWMRGIYLDPHPSSLGLRMDP